jgi:SprT protein
MPEKSEIYLSLEQFRGAIPPRALSYFHTLLDNKKLAIRHVRFRKTKLGDFRHFRNGIPPVITVNRNLQSDALLFILTHEIAHFMVFHRYGRNVPPHGDQWKTEFRNLLNDLLDLAAFSEASAAEIRSFTNNVKAAISRNHPLHRLLFPDTHAEQDGDTLDILPECSLFTIQGDVRVFKKGHLRRTRYMCKCIDNNRLYLVNRNLKVIPFE